VFGIELCPECGVPLMISASQRWEDNGVITLAMSPTNRVVFYEAGIIDNLFKGIEELIGTDVWHIVTESRRPDVRKFIEQSFPAEMMGSVGAFEQTDMRVEYREIAENIYEVTASPGSHPIGLKERLKKKRYPFKPGEIRYERCSRCGVPTEVGNCGWDLEHGTIYDPVTQRRMAIFGPWAVDSVLDDLKEELGESVQETVIEALRRHLRSTMSEEMWKQDMVTFNRMSALRGLGNLVQFEGDREYLTVTFENACMPLLMVGTVQGLFEMAMRKKASTYEWELAEDGDLTVTVRGQQAMAPVESPAMKGNS